MDDLTQPNARPSADKTTYHAPTHADLDRTQAAAHIVSSPPPNVSRPAPTPQANRPTGYALNSPPAAPQMPPASPTSGVGGLARWLYVLIALAVVGVALVGSLGAFLLHQSVAAQAEPPAAQPAAAQSVITATVVPSQPTPAPTQGVAIQPWDGKQRFTMLLMGIDKRPGEAGTAFRTDVMMIISIDPANHSIGMLSVPRDLFVTLPPNTVVGSGYGLQRINSAYTIGEAARPGSGAQLAMQTVQYNLGIRINDYVVVEFGTVIGVVDAVGGVDVDVPGTINDPEYPDMNFGYSPLYIPAGHVHMNGALALKYARSRHGSSDLDRAKRQQQIITAVRDKILSLNMAPHLIAQAPTLWGQLNSGVHTDLSLDQMLQLALYAKDVPKANVHQGVIDYSYVKAQVWQGMDILVPDRAAIGPLMVQVFGASYNG